MTWLSFCRLATKRAMNLSQINRHISHRRLAKRGMRRSRDICCKEVVDIGDRGDRRKGAPPAAAPEQEPWTLQHVGALGTTLGIMHDHVGQPRSQLTRHANSLMEAC